MDRIPMSDPGDYVRGNPMDDNLQAPYNGPSDFHPGPAITEPLLEYSEYCGTVGLWPGMAP